MRTHGKKRSAQILKVPLQSRCHRWLEVLVETGRYGNSKADVAVVLLGKQFTALIEAREISNDVADALQEIPFPASKAHEAQSTKTSERIGP